MAGELEPADKRPLTPRTDVDLGFAKYQLSGRSALSGELVRLTPRIRQVLSVTPAVIVALDLLVTAARLLTDDSDPRSLRERMDDFSERMLDLEDPIIAEHFHAFSSKVVEFAEDPNARKYVDRWVRRLTTPAYLRVARRLLGAATYDRIRSAFDDDAAAMVVAIRRLTRHVMPFAVAIDDCIAVLSPEQLAEAEVFSPEQSTFLQIGLMIDTFFDNVFQGRLQQQVVTSRPEERRAWDIADLESIADRIHDILEGRTREELEQLSGRLARKVRGARDALQGSADASSQAANSLIEFIDRLMREAFSEEYSLDWIKRNRPDDRNLTYFDANRNRERPTKRGQALCFIFAGEDPKEAMPIHETIASSLNETRRALQKIKHNDSGSEEELDQLRRLMASVEGFVIYAIRIGWATTSSDRVTGLRDRLAGE